jgi:opacity protein-like surface antigen
VKRSVLVLLLAASAALVRPAAAQVWGQYTSAETVPVNGHLFGGYLHASNNFLGLLAQLRLSFYPNIDFGFQGGLTRISTSAGNDVTSLRIGTDLKALVAHTPRLDWSLGGALGVETGDNLHVLTVGPTVVASHTFGNASGGGVTPYAGAGLMFSNVEIEDRSFTDFSMPFRLGAEFRLAPEVRLCAELQLRASDEVNDDFGIVTGVNLPF